MTQNKERILSFFEEKNKWVSIGILANLFIGGIIIITTSRYFQIGYLDLIGYGMFALGLIHMFANSNLSIHNSGNDPQ